jgi:hypothetical protein
MNRALIAIVSLVIGAAIGGTAVRLYDQRGARDAVATAPAENAVATPVEAGLSVGSPAGNGASDGTMAEPEPDASVAVMEEPVAADPGPAEGPAPTAGALAAMMENPVMRDLIRQQSLAQMKVQYGAFFEDLGLDDELAGPIYDILLERTMVAIEKAGQALDGDLPDADRAAARQDLETAWEASETEINELLGDEAFGEFKLYEKSMTERMELSSLKQSMEGRAPEITEAQEDELMAIMFEEREKFPFTNNFTDQEKFFEVDRSDASFESFAGEYEQLHAVIERRAADVLSPDQMAVFSENQKNFRNMITQTVKMNYRMLEPD